ncbi:MAG: 50S ribosomal protein L13 [Lentisphaerae bacterium]|nr:MAG: 50S ribosomal protein L13 [Lentisphaerota bacterium]
MKTYLPKVDQIERKWYLVDAEGQTLGRLAVKIANILRGRHKPIYTPHLDTGDYVIVVNAEKVKLSGNKEKKKIYQDYSGWMGGLKEQTAAEVRARKPERLIRDAVSGMIPRNRLGRQVLRKLKVYAGPNHEHAAQKPEKLEL